MIYLEHRPTLPLDSFVERFWYCRAQDLPHARERVLPTGRAQLLFNLASNELVDCCPRTGEEIGRLPGALLAGPRISYEVIACEDLRELIGVVFRPNGFAPLWRVNARSIFENFVPVEEICGNGLALRDRLCEIPNPVEKLAFVERWLLREALSIAVSQNVLVAEGLKLLRNQRVEQVARNLGVSMRRLHQLFTAEVGVSPKQWACITRFQRAVRVLHSGQSPHWEELALDCGFYDQSQFCREFRDYSGINPSTYISSVGTWANHVRMS